MSWSFGFTACSFFGWLLNIWYFLKLLNQDSVICKTTSKAAQQLKSPTEKLTPSAFAGVFCQGVVKSKGSGFPFLHGCTKNQRGWKIAALFHCGHWSWCPVNSYLSNTEVFALAVFSEHTVCSVFRGLLQCFFPHLKLKCEFSSQSFGLKAAEGIADVCVKNGLPGSL